MRCVCVERERETDTRRERDRAENVKINACVLLIGCDIAVSFYCINTLLPWKLSVGIAELAWVKVIVEIIATVLAENEY